MKNTSNVRVRRDKDDILQSQRTWFKNRRKKKKPCFVSYWYSTDTYWFCCKFENTNLVSQRAIGLDFQTEERADVFAMPVLRVQNQSVSHLPDDVQAQDLQFYIWEILPWLLSGKQCVRCLETYAHSQLWKSVCGCNVSCFRHRTHPCVISCR